MTTAVQLFLLRWHYEGQILRMLQIEYLAIQIQCNIYDWRRIETKKGNSTARSEIKNRENKLKKLYAKMGLNLASSSFRTTEMALEPPMWSHVRGHWWTISLSWVHLSMECKRMKPPILVKLTQKTDWIQRWGFIHFYKLTQCSFRSIWLGVPYSGRIIQLF